MDGKGNELMLMQQNECEGMAGGMGGGLDEFFWCAHLRRLVNLTHLNLNLITTDEILLLGKQENYDISSFFQSQFFLHIWSGL